MKDNEQPGPARPAGEIPLGQRIYDNWGLLMVVGILIMAAIYTGWGLWEIYSLPKATLP